MEVSEDSSKPLKVFKIWVVSVDPKSPRFSCQSSVGHGFYLKVLRYLKCPVSWSSQYGLFLNYHRVRRINVTIVNVRICPEVRVGNTWSILDDSFLNHHRWLLDLDNLLLDNLLLDRLNHFLV